MNVFAICKSIEGVPSVIQILPYGRVETEKGPFVVDEEGMAGIIADFEAQKNDMVIDYEHQTLSGGEAPAAGWIKKLVNKGKDGLWAVVEWTDRAGEYLKNREYRYLSPVFFKTIKDNRAVRLVNAALTNTPAIDGMVPLVNKLDVATLRKEEGKMLKKIIKLLVLKDDATEEQAEEAVKGLLAQGKVLTAMKETLGLKPEATQEEVIQAMKTPGAPVHKEVLETLGLKEGASLSEVKGTIVAMKEGSGQASDLGKRVAELEGRLKAQDAEALVAAAMKEGKVTPAEKEAMLTWAKKDPVAFQAYAKVATPKVHTGEVAAGGGRPGDGGLTDTQLAVNKALGVSAEAFKKYNPAQ